MSYPVIQSRFVEVEEALLRPHGVLHAMYSLWAEAGKDTDQRPPRSRIDPLHLPPASWRHCFLIDCPESGYRVRLFGTYMVELAGRDPTGRRLSEFRPDAETNIDRDAFERVRTGQRPVLWLHHLPMLREPPALLLVTLLLPLFGTAGTVEMILGGSLMPPPDGAASDDEPSVVRRQTLVQGLYHPQRRELAQEDGVYLIRIPPGLGA